MPEQADAPEALLADEPHEVEVLTSEVGFHGKVWDIRRDDFRYGDSTITREYVDHTGAVAILAQDDEGRVLLIRQYRHPIRTRDWELPAGLLDQAGEAPLEAARRELAEEADLAAEHWEQLAHFHSTPGGSNETITVYLARGLSSTDAFARAEEEADIEPRWAPLADVVDAVLQGRLMNSILTIAVLTLAARDAGAARD